MRKVTIVVPVLITSCHVSLKWNVGPVIPQTSMISTAKKKAAGCPVARAVSLADWLNRDATFMAFLLGFSRGWISNVENKTYHSHKRMVARSPRERCTPCVNEAASRPVG